MDWHKGQQMTGRNVFGFFLSLVLSIWVAVPIRAAEKDPAESKGYVCPFLAQAPELDGDVLNDSVWRELPVARGYRNLGTGQPSLKQTTFRLGYTLEALFVGVVCEEPDPDQLRADMADGERFLGEDALAVLFSPDNETMLLFAVNAIGSRTSSRTLKKWQAQLLLGDDHWSVEMAIPWEVLGAFPAQGKTWGLNILRDIPSQQDEEFSTWANLQYTFEEPENLGQLRFEPIEPDKREAIEGRIRNQTIREEILVYSRPRMGVLFQSEFSEDKIVYNQGAHVAPRLSPDANRILFNSVEGGEMGVWLVDRVGKEKERVCDGTQAAWSPDGTGILFQRGGRLVERVLASGEETVVSPEGCPPLAFPSYLLNGGIPGKDSGFRFVCTDETGQHVYLVASDGNQPLETLLEGDIRSAPVCSPDGKTLAFQDGAHIYLMDLATREVRQLTVEPGVQACPVWGADSRSLCYARAPSPFAEVSDICCVRIDSPQTVNLIERRVHPGFDWSGIPPQSARTTEVSGTHLTLWRKDGALGQTPGPDMLGSDEWKVVPEHSSPTPVDGSLAIENDWLILCVSSEGVFLVPKGQSAPAEPVALRVTDNQGMVTDEVADIHIVSNSGDSFKVKASFRVKGDRLLTSTIRVPRTRPFIEVLKDNGVGRIGVQADMDFAVVPDRFSNDLVLDSGILLSGAMTPLPQTPVMLGCLSDSGTMVLLATPLDTASFAVANSEDGKQLAAITAEPDAKSVVIAVLAGSKMWERPAFENDAGSMWHAKWKRPFYAEWRMAVRSKDAAYARMWNARDLGAVGGSSLPIDDRRVQQPETGVVYVWGRDVITPGTVLTPADILVDVWGIDGYRTRLDIEGIQGYRTAAVPVPFRDLVVHRPDWHPAMAHTDSGEFGVLDIIGSLFPTDTDGVRSLLRHLGDDALNMLRGLDDRIAEYERFLGDLGAFCQARTGEDPDGFLTTVSAKTNSLLEYGRNAHKTDIAEIDKALERLLRVVGTRDNITLKAFQAYCGLPGNQGWAETFEDFWSYLAAREGRIWYNDTIRFELWYDDTFMGFSYRCRRFLAERQRILSEYRTWVKNIRDGAAQLTITHPESQATGDELRRMTHAILRNRYYLEGDWRGETPLPTGALQ